MNWKHLLWIVPVALVIGAILGVGYMGIGITSIAEEYPIIGCIMLLEDSINYDQYGFGSAFTSESLRDAIQWRCAKEHVDFNVTDIDKLFVFKG